MQSSHAARRPTVGSKDEQNGILREDAKEQQLGAALSNKVERVAKTQARPLLSRIFPVRPPSPVTNGDIDSGMAKLALSNVQSAAKSDPGYKDRDLLERIARNDHGLRENLCMYHEAIIEARVLFSLILEKMQPPFQDQLPVGHMRAYMDFCHQWLDANHKTKYFLGVQGQFSSIVQVAVNHPLPAVQAQGQKLRELLLKNRQPAAVCFCQQPELLQDLRLGNETLLATDEQFVLILKRMQPANGPKPPAEKTVVYLQFCKTWLQNYSKANPKPTLPSELCTVFRLLLESASSYTDTQVLEQVRQLSEQLARYQIEPRGITQPISCKENFASLFQNVAAGSLDEYDTVVRKIAKDLMRQNWQLLQQISIEHLMDKWWYPPAERERHTEFFNRLKEIIVQQVLEATTDKRRERVINFYIDIAKKSYEMLDFTTPLFVRAAFSDNKIQRLQRTEGARRIVQSKFLSDLDRLYDIKGNYSNFRPLLTANQDKFHIPFIGIWKGDLEHASDGGTRTTIKNGNEEYNLEDFAFRRELANRWTALKSKPFPYKLNKFYSDLTFSFMESFQFQEEATLEKRSKEIAPQGSLIVRAAKK